jgi:hypothetical protein
MSYLISFLFLVAGAINLAPVSGAISSEQLERLYHIGAASSDVELLLRHRAILFGIVGSIIIVAAFVPGLRLTATLSGLVSMVSFIVLVFATKSGSASLVQIAWIDVVATLILLLGFALHLAAAGQPPSNV